MKTGFHDLRRGCALRTAIGMVLLAFLMLAGTAGAASFAYIPIHNDQTVSIIDTATNAIVTTVPLGTLPWGVAVSPDGKMVYVTNDEESTVSIIDTCSKKVINTTPLMSGSMPIGVAVNPAGTKVYVANNGHNTVSVIDTATNIYRTVTVGGSPYGVAVSPDGTEVYVTNSGSNSVSVIDTATNTINTTVTVGISPEGVAVTPDGKRVYVANRGSSTMSVIDTASYGVTSLFGGLGLLRNPCGVAVNPAGTKVYVTNDGSNTVSVIDIPANTNSATITVEDSPAGVAVTPDGTKVYVGNRAPGNTPVSIINTTTNAVATMSLGNGPIAFGQFIGIQPSCHPYIHIDPIGDRFVGDKFTITATTNLAVGEEVVCEVYNSSLGHLPQPGEIPAGEFAGASGTVTVTAGSNNLNRTSFDLDVSTFRPDTYVVNETAVNQNVNDIIEFNVIEGSVTTFTVTPTASATRAAPDPVLDLVLALGALGVGFIVIKRG